MIWLMSSFPCSKTTRGKVKELYAIAWCSCKNNPKFHCEGADGWSLTAVRCFAPAEVKASNPFWREQRRGAWEQLQQNTERHHEHNRQELRLPPPRLCFFLTKVARSCIRYKEKTLIKFSGLQLNNQLLIATSVLKRYPKMLRPRQVRESRQDEDAQRSCYCPLGHCCSKARVSWEISILGPEAHQLLLRWRKRGTWAAYLLTELSEGMLATGNPTSLSLWKGWGWWREEHK